MKSGNAVIALDEHLNLAGFCYIETWEEKKYVANSGLIVDPKFRGQGLAKKAQKVGQAAGDMAAQKLLKPGTEIPIGGQNVKVDKVSGNEVILADPKNKNAPKTIVQKKDPIIKQALKSITT